MLAQESFNPFLDFRAVIGPLWTALMDLRSFRGWPSISLYSLSSICLFHLVWILKCLPNIYGQDIISIFFSHIPLILMTLTGHKFLLALLEIAN